MEKCELCYSTDNEYISGIKVCADCGEEWPPAMERCRHCDSTKKRHGAGIVFCGDCDSEWIPAIEITLPSRKIETQESRGATFFFFLKGLPVLVIAGFAFVYAREIEAFFAPIEVMGLALLAIVVLLAAAWWLLKTAYRRLKRR